MTGLEGPLVAALGAAAGHWTLKQAVDVGGVAWDNRNRLTQAWAAIYRRLQGTNYPIIVCGISGNGKSVLASYLSRGRPSRRGSQLPAMSQAAESERAGDHGQFEISVWPGHNSPGRAKAIRDAKKRGNAVGMIYVVSNGLAHPWQPEIADVLKRQKIMSIADYQIYRRRQEVEDFKSTQTHIVELPKLSWLLVAVAKADLWWTNDDAKSKCMLHYGLDETQPFVKAGAELLQRVGSNNINLAVRPVSTSLEFFVYGDERLVPAISESQRNGFLENFLITLSELCVV